MPSQKRVSGNQSVESFRSVSINASVISQFQLRPGIWGVAGRWAQLELTDA